MIPYIQEATKVTPKIDFNNETGVFELTGRSLPEQTYELYKPLIEWVDSYTNNPVKKTILHINLEYVNSSSNKYIMLLLKKLDDFYNKGFDVVIYWYYEEEDEDTYETITEYQEILTLPIEICKLEE